MKFWQLRKKSLAINGRIIEFSSMGEVEKTPGKKRNRIPYRTLKGEMFHEEIPDVNVRRTCAQPLVVSRRLHRCRPPCTATSSIGCPTTRASYDDKCGATPREGRGHGSSTLPPACLSSRTLGLEWKVGLTTWLLGNSSPSLCQMGSWPLEASARWLGLDSWTLEMPLT